MIIVIIIEAGILSTAQLSEAAAAPAAPAAASLRVLVELADGMEKPPIPNSKHLVNVCF